MLQDVVVLGSPRAIPLAIFTMRKAIHGFDVSMGLCLAAVWAARASL